MTMLIRKATENDLPAILKIERLSQVSPWTLETFNMCFREKYFSWVAESEINKNEKVICGFIFMSSPIDEAHILNIAVAYPFQRQGIGRLLLEAAHVHAKKMKVHLIYLEVRATNLPAKKLYEKMGYKKIGVRENYYETVSGREDAEVFMLEL